MGLVFFAGTMFARGYVIVRGPVVPRWIGVFLMIDTPRRATVVVDGRT